MRPGEYSLNGYLADVSIRAAGEPPQFLGNGTGARRQGTDILQCGSGFGMAFRFDQLDRIFCSQANRCQRLVQFMSDARRNLTER